jgi:nucleoside-diphosphate-sugar epimerase
VRVILAGGAGFLGTALDRALRQQGHTVHVLTRRPAAELW